MSKELGVCPASVEASCDCVNNGRNAGRICWIRAGTFSGGKIQGTFANKHLSCMGCDVFIRVKKEEGNEAFKLMMSQDGQP